MKKNVKILSKICIIIFLIFAVLLTLFLPLIFIKIHYKTKYKNIIENELKLIENKSEELTTNLILSIILAESGFDANAKSGKDAFGLMQLTFSTANEVATNLGLEISITDLYNPNLNIKLGVNYLQYLFNQNFSQQKIEEIATKKFAKSDQISTKFNKKQVEKIEQNNNNFELENFQKFNQKQLVVNKNFNKTQLVLLSYNAGLTRVKNWLENDEIFEKNGYLVCPFEETTNYCKKVLKNQKIYNKFV